MQMLYIKKIIRYKVIFHNHCQYLECDEIHNFEWLKSDEETLNQHYFQYEIVFCNQVYGKQQFYPNVNDTAYMLDIH